jgi:hypothetical protein
MLSRLWGRKGGEESPTESPPRNETQKTEETSESGGRLAPKRGPPRATSKRREAQPPVPSNQGPEPSLGGYNKGEITEKPMGNSEKACAFGANLNKSPERRSRTPDYSPVYTPAFCGPDPPDPLDRGGAGNQGGGSRKWGKSVNMDSRGSVPDFESGTESGDEEKEEHYLQIHYNPKAHEEPQDPAETAGPRNLFKDGFEEMQMVECQPENTPEALEWGLPNLALPCGEIPAGRDPLVNPKNFQIPNFPSGGPLLPYGARVPQEAAAFPVGGCLWNWRHPLRFWLPLQRHFRRRGRRGFP